MRVAYIGIKGLPARGGAERVVEAVAARMPALGITPVVYCDRRYTPPGTKVDGVELIRLPTIPGKYTRQLSLDLLAALHAVLFGGYGLIHLQHVEGAFVLPILRLRYRVVSTSHGAAYRTAKWGPLAKVLMRMMVWPFARLSTLTTFVSAKDAEDLCGRRGRTGLYVPNGIGTEHVPDLAAAREIQTRHGLRPGEYLVFVAGRIEPIKGAHLAIGAVNRLSCDMPLLIVGDDSQVPSYGQSLREMAGPNVKFHPPIADPTVLFGLMADARCLVFPSLVEAMSMVLLEAVSLGVPVISSDIPENTAVLRNEGVYFRSGDVESLAEKIQWALKHPREMAEVASAAQSRVQREHSWDLIAGQYAEIYKRALDGGRRDLTRGSEAG